MLGTNLENNQKISYLCIVQVAVKSKPKQGFPLHFDLNTYASTKITNWSI